MNQSFNKEKHRQIKAECARRGIAIRRPSKHCWHLIGPGVDLLVADLASVTPDNLAPYTPKD